LIAYISNQENMRKLSAFWKKDFLNKLIITLFFLLAMAGLAFAFLITRLPSGKSINGVIDDFFPTTTEDPRLVMTRAAGISLTQIAAATASVQPTMTTMPFDHFKKTPSRMPAQLTQATPTNIPTITKAITPVQAITSSPTGTPIRLTLTPSKLKSTLNPANTPNPSALVPNGFGNLTCIPKNNAQRGIVLDVLDGITIKVMVDNLVYVVRYIGVQLPTNVDFAKLAAFSNGDMTFGREIFLIQEVTDKDESGRLLRYVSTRDQFPGAELLKKGLVFAVDAPPNSACAAAFQDLEQSARNAKSGIWEFPSIIPTAMKP
jgi:endonuclease YncB( thermonuclease family)